MDESIIQVSYLKDTSVSTDSNDTVEIRNNQLNFSSFLSESDQPSSANSSLVHVVSKVKRKRRKKKDISSISNSPIQLPPSKKQKTEPMSISESSSSKSSTSKSSSFMSEILRSIDEHTITSYNLYNFAHILEKITKKLDTKPDNKKRQILKTEQPLRRSARLRKKRKKCSCDSSDDTDIQMKALSVDLCELRLKQKQEIIANNHDLNKEINENNKITKEDSLSSMDGWNDIGSNSFISRWNAKATPIKSSLRINKRKKRVMSTNKKVNWGKIECRNYEQRCGVFSCAVPNEHGPSLHLGKLVSTATVKIDEYEQLKDTDKECKQVPKKVRIQRVKLFKPESCEPDKLKEENAEIKSLQKSRTEIGCKCMSVYKMKKTQLIGRILYLDKTKTKKQLNKLKKKQCFDMLINLQFAKYGRYDVMCVDDFCSCFVHGIECQIGGDCCQCGGDVVYNNFIPHHINGENDIKKEKQKKINKKDSLCCANPNGNTLNCNVLNFVVDMNGNKAKECTEHDIAKEIPSSFLEFKSPIVQRYIDEWNSHYDNDNDDE